MVLEFGFEPIQVCCSVFLGSYIIAVFYSIITEVWACTASVSIVRNLHIAKKRTYKVLASGGLTILDKI